MSDAPANRKFPKDPLLIDEEGHVECLLGNEAIVRGALEAGVAFACGYPGTPSSEVTDSFARIAPAYGIPFEYSVNEKIALEMAFAASLAGARSICAMKHLGLMVAGDPLSTIPYVGVESGMVVVSAGDPSCRTSPNEQDQRHLGPMLHLPMLDPSTPHEAHGMARFAFELSEGCRLPVILRTTTRVSHTRANVSYGPLVAPQVHGFERNPARYVPIPVNARRMRLELVERLERARELLAANALTRLRSRGTGAAAVIATGVPAATCADVIDALGIADRVTLYSLGGVYPLPETELVQLLRGHERLLVLEELTPFVEDALRALVARHGLKTEVLGKRSGHCPQPFEYEPPVIQRALGAAFGEQLGLAGTEDAAVVDALAVPPRPPSLCPGCPHRAAYGAARAAFDDDQLYFNDIGCYTLGYGAPLETADALLSMGAGFTLAAGVARVTGQRTVGFMGDSTFFHSGMPALLNAIKQRVGMVAVILDNEVTAMTGFQQSPAHSDGPNPDIEAVVRALGAEHVEKIDPYETGESVAAFRRARDAAGLSVVIVRRACPVHASRQQGQARDAVVTYEIDQHRCRTCGRESDDLRCGQCMTVSYERTLTRSRATQQRDAQAARPRLAPCGMECPLSICIQGYAGNIAAGEYRAALAQVLDRTPLPETVCRVCHRPCEPACVRTEMDEAIAINDLKRFVIDWASAQEHYPYQPAREPDCGMKVAVIGAGPSGLGAAHELAMRGYRVTLYDAADRPGGLLALGIPRYRMPPGALERDIARVLELGVSFQGNTALGRDLSLSALLDDESVAAVYLAIGAHRGRRLELPGADASTAPPQIDALAFLKAVQRGEQAADAPRRVVVVGGGNAAVDAARTARRLGAVQVTMGCLETRRAMPALPEEILAAEAEGIVIRDGVEPRRLDGGTIVFAPLDGGDEIVLEADRVVVAIGQDPDLSFLEGDALELAFDDQGCLVVDRISCMTSNPRLFAGGDLTSAAARTVTGAIAWGQRAAWGIDRALRGFEVASKRVPPKPPESWEPQPGRPVKTPPARRRRPPELDAGQRSESFDEVIGALSEAEAKAEASRCLICGLCGNCRACIDTLGCPAIDEVDGAIAIDPLLCNGCGVCAELCPNDAIHPRGAS